MEKALQITVSVTLAAGFCRRIGSRIGPMNAIGWNVFPGREKASNCFGKGKDMRNLKRRMPLRLMASILCGLCVLLFCQCTRKNSQKPVEIHLLLNRHPFTEAILRFIPEYEQKTGIKVTTLLLSEEEYFEKLITELSSRSPYYDLFMLGFPHIWQYAKAGWLEPLNPLMENPNLTPADWDAE